jgi:hypothetical protein
MDEKSSWSSSSIAWKLSRGNGLFTVSLTVDVRSGKRPKSSGNSVNKVVWRYCGDIPDRHQNRDILVYGDKLGRISGHSTGNELVVFWGRVYGTAPLQMKVESQPPDG